MQAVATAVTTAAPVLVDEVKKRAPAVYTRAKEWFTQRGTTLEKTVEQAVSKKDTTMGAVLVEAFTNPRVAGKDAQRVFAAFAASSPSLDIETMKRVTSQLAALKSAELANAVTHHEVLSGDPVAKIAEVSRMVGKATKILGLTESELVELLIFFANVGPEDIATVRAFRTAAQLKAA